MDRRRTVKRFSGHGILTFRLGYAMASDNDLIAVSHSTQLPSLLTFVFAVLPNRWLTRAPSFSRPTKQGRTTNKTAPNFTTTTHGLRFSPEDIPATIGKQHENLAL